MNNNNLSKSLTVIIILLVAMLFVQIASIASNPVSVISKECETAKTHAKDVISKVNSTAEMEGYKKFSESMGSKTYEMLGYTMAGYDIFALTSIIEQQQVIIGLLQHCSN